MGYHRAGFEVVGVDIKPQPHYPFKFMWADAMTFPLDGYDVIHASPPCQLYSTMTPKQTRKKHPDFLPIIAKKLQDCGKPYCIENVAGARKLLKNPFMLCGSMFNLPIFRHRFFEANFFVLTPSCKHNFLPILVTTAGKNSCTARPLQKGIRRKSIKYAPEAYGINWMNYQELRESIPPAYTEWIGKQVMRKLKNEMTLIGEENGRLSI